MNDTPIFLSMTRKMRVWQVAKALGVTSKDVLPHAKKYGARSASSSLTAFHADCVVEDYTGRKQRLVFAGPKAAEGTAPKVLPSATVLLADLENDKHNNVLRTCHIAGREGRWWILADVSPRVGETRYRVGHMDTGQVLNGVRASQIHNCY